MSDSPIQISAQLEGLDALQRKFKAAPQAFDGYMRKFMQKALPVIEREVKIKTPVNTGALRASIGHEIRGTGAQMQGVVGTAKEYAPFVELGAKPHWSPRAAIQYWVMRKFKLTGSELFLAVRGVQRAIATRGTKGRHMFQQAFEETQAKVKDLWNETWGEAVRKEL